MTARTGDPPDVPELAERRLARDVRPHATRNQLVDARFHVEVQLGGNVIVEPRTSS